MVSGSIISETFRGKTDHRRQRMLREAVEAELGYDLPNELVGTLLAYTPLEWNMDLGTTRKAVPDRYRPRSRRPPQAPRASARLISIAKIQKILTTGVGLREPRFKLHDDGYFVSGSVIETFRGKSDIQRQEMIRKALGKDTFSAVSMLLAYMPDEWDVDLVFFSNGHTANPGQRDLDR
jgi:acid stress-induced BolA-like protein IbaG/YrbA